jgi:4-hydroxybenzoate polyprenyltransferase
LIKDIEDINGDQNGGRRTLPITIGIARTAQVSMVIGLILIVSIGSMVAIALNYSILLSTQLTVALILAIWITYKCHKIEIPSKAKSVSLWLKILLAIGLLSIFWL